MGGRTLAGDTAESCECSIIDTRFRVYSGQARAASLAETVGTTTPAFLLRLVYYVSNMLMLKLCVLYVKLNLLAISWCAVSSRRRVF